MHCRLRQTVDSHCAVRMADFATPTNLKNLILQKTISALREMHCGLRQTATLQCARPDFRKIPYESLLLQKAANKKHLIKSINS